MNIPDFNKLFSTALEETERNFIVYTGDAGYNAIDRAIKVHNALDQLVWMLDTNLIDVHKKESLETMINSPDIDDFNFALELMIQFQKSNQNGNNIQSRNTQV